MATLRLLQGQHGTGTDDDAVLGVKRVRLHQIELDHQLLPPSLNWQGLSLVA